MRNLILDLCMRLGITRLFASLNKRKVVIVALHAVADEQPGQNWRPLRDMLSSARFADYMRAMARQHNIVSMDRAVGIIKGTEPPVDRALAITFDDGYLNNITRALPVMESLGAPFIVYLTAGLIEKREPMWVDRLDYAVTAAGSEPVQMNLADQAFEISGSTQDERAASFKRMRRGAKGVDCDDRDFLAAIDGVSSTLEGLAGRRLQDVFEDDEWAGLLKWDDCTAANSMAANSMAANSMAANSVTANSTAANPGLVSYGSHTLSHLRIARVPADVAREELTESRKLIEERLGRPCAHFAYPDGSYNAEAAQLVADCGYSSAVTSDVGVNLPGDDVFTLKRLSVPVDTPTSDLLARTSGLLDALNAVKRRFRG